MSRTDFTVSYEGREYRIKSKNPSVGDLAMFVVDLLDISAGKLYEIEGISNIGSIIITDDIGDEHHRDFPSGQYIVLSPVEDGEDGPKTYEYIRSYVESRIEAVPQADYPSCCDEIIIAELEGVLDTISENDARTPKADGNKYDRMFASLSTELTKLRRDINVIRADMAYREDVVEFAQTATQAEMTAKKSQEDILALAYDVDALKRTEMERRK